MAEPIVTKAWLWEGEGGDEWTVEIEHDRMNVNDQVTVTILARTVEAGAVDDTLIAASPEQAREMATALLVYAHLADKANARVAALGDQDRVGE